jgi:hypothetical protein
MRQPFDREATRRMLGATWNRAGEYGRRILGDRRQGKWREALIEGRTRARRDDRAAIEGVSVARSCTACYNRTAQLPHDNSRLAGEGCVYGCGSIARTIICEPCDIITNQPP